LKTCPFSNYLFISKEINMNSITLKISFALTIALGAYIGFATSTINASDLFR